MEFLPSILGFLDGYSAEEVKAIFAMQGFAGLSLFSVFLLMALGLHHFWPDESY